MDDIYPSDQEIYEQEKYEEWKAIGSDSDEPHEFDDLNECETGWYFMGEFVFDYQPGAEWYDPSKDETSLCFICGKNRNADIHKVTDGIV